MTFTCYDSAVAPTESFSEHLQTSCRCAAPRLTGALNPDTLYMKIHAVFSQLGFKLAAAKVSLPDQATLCAVEHWIYMQQGLVWKQMTANFAAEGACLVLVSQEPGCNRDTAALTKAVLKLQARCTCIHCLTQIQGSFATYQCGHGKKTFAA